MPQGIEVYNAAGRLVFNSDGRVSRSIGSASITGVDGSVTDAALLTGDPVFFFVSDPSFAYRVYPTFSISGSTISWTYPATGGLKINGTLIYGVY